MLLLFLFINSSKNFSVIHNTVDSLLTDTSIYLFIYLFYLFITTLFVMINNQYKKATIREELNLNLNLN